MGKRAIGTPAVPRGWRALLVALVIGWGAVGGHPAAARTLDIFVINFGVGESSDVVTRLYQQHSATADVTVVIDATEPALIGYADRNGSPPTGTAEGLRSIQERYRGSREPALFNLAHSLDFVADILRRFSGTIDQADIFLINTIFHQDDTFRFADGYPNDGFLFRDDNEFASIDRIALAKPPRLHVLATGRTDFAQQYQRFFHHLGKTLFNANLTTFSLTPTAGAMTLGDLPVVELAPIDRTVLRSLVIGKDTAPVCAYEDRVTRADSATREVTLTVVNPCRRNSVVSFTVQSGGRTRPENLRADDEGRVQLRLELRAGLNTVNLQRLDNEPVEIFKLDLNPDDDQITQAVNEGTADLTGRNPLRRDGDEVTITHPASGRSWTIRVADGAWHLAVPVQPGVQRFLVSRPGNLGSPQVVDVNAGRSCADVVEAREVRGTGTIRIVNPCRAGQPIVFRTREDSYPRSFDPTGAVELKLSLACGPNDIAYPGQDGGQRIAFLETRCDDLIKITLKWQAPVDLDLHVQEQNADPGKAGWIYYGNLNRDNRRGLGELDIDDRGAHEGAKVENYQVQASRYPAGKLPKFYVVYFSRGSDPKLPYCGDGPLARVPYQVTVLNRGRSETYDGVFESVPCDKPLPKDPRLLGKPGPDERARPALAVPPLAVDDQATTASGVPVEIAVLANDSPPPGERLEVTEVLRPEHGTAEALPGGTVRYRSAPGFVGTDHFTYRVGDGRGNAASAKVTVTVTAAVAVVAPPPPAPPPLPPTPAPGPAAVAVPPPPPPSSTLVAYPDSAFVETGKSTSINVLANDRAPAGATVRVTRAPANGQVDGGANGTFSYRPRPSFQGIDHFSYQLSSGSLAPSVAEVTVWVGQCNQRIDDQRLPQLTPTQLYICGRSTLEQGEILGAMLLLDLAAGKNHGPSLTLMGRLHDPGQAVANGLVPADAAKAAEFYRRAVAAGDGEAKGWLERLEAH